MQPDDGPDGRSALRAALFRETPAETIQRWVLGTAWALRPRRIGNLPALARLALTNLVDPERGLPDPERALNPAGLAGMVQDLSPETLVEAYRRGLFTFTHFGPLKWLSPEERCVLFIDEFHLGKTMRRLVRLGRYRVTFDRDFEGVIKACAGRRAGRWHLTWITPRIMRANADLYDAGYAHSFEVWNDSGELAGGGYGVAIGGAFFTESLFSRERDTSKIGFATLNWHLAERGFVINDGKWMNPVLSAMGYQAIPRSEFLGQLARATERPGWSGRWQVTAGPETISTWQSRPVRADLPQVAKQSASGALQKARNAAMAIGTIDASGLSLAESLCAVI